MFIGRKNELTTLKEKYNSDNFELGIMYGQRRIGKTSIILESTKGYSYIYFLAREDTYSNNLVYFETEFAKFAKTPFTPHFNSFDELFDSLINYVSDSKTIIIIDELPFLAKAYPGVVSYLQSLADSLKLNEKKAKIILSGSDISFMVDLLTNRAKPLYQRATFKIHVKPMIFTDAVEMLSGIANEDIVKYLSIFGNRPYYLDKIDKNKTFDENIMDLCFNKNNILIDAPNITLPIGYSTNSVFTSILIAIASHKQRVKEIADSLRIDSNAASTYLGRMLEGESIEKRETFKGNVKTNYYEISDPFIRFYYRLIFKNLPLIERGLGKDIYRTNVNVIDNVICHGFEDVVNSYMDELNKKEKLPVVCNVFKKYDVSNSSLGRPIEIDGLAESLDGKKLIVVECKFKNENVSAEILEHLKESVSVFEEKYEEIYYYLFSKKSFSNELLAMKDPRVKLITLDEMIGASVFRS